MHKLTDKVHPYDNPGGEIIPVGEIPVGEKFDPYKQIPIPVSAILDDKAESLGWGLQPSGEVQLAKAIKKTTQLTSDLHVQHTEVQTLVSWREYSNDSGVVGIYYTDQWGAHVTYGAIRDKFRALGGTSSYLGFPTADESGNSQNNRWSNFNGGTIYWDGLMAYTKVSVDAHTQPLTGGRAVRLDITGLTPGGQFIVYRNRLFDDNCNHLILCGTNYADTDGSYFGFDVFDVDENYSAEDTWMVVDAETQGHNNPVL